MNYSRQREEIIHFLQSRKDHPTAETVYENVRKIYPKISLGTIYRNLTLLADNGVILRLRLSDGIDHFDADVSEHYHVICQNCGSVVDLDLKEKIFPIDTNILNYNGIITGQITYFTGICSECIPKTNNNL